MASNATTMTGYVLVCRHSDAELLTTIEDVPMLVSWQGEDNYSAEIAGVEYPVHFIDGTPAVTLNVARVFPDVITCERVRQVRL